MAWLREALADEGSGNIVKDTSGNGNDGIIHGATWVDGKYGKALSFDGVNDYVDCGNDESLKINGNQITVEAWVYIKGDGINWGIIVIGGQVNTAYTLTKYNGNDDRILWRHKNSGRRYGYGEVKSASAVSRNVWLHIAAVYDGSTDFGFRISDFGFHISPYLDFGLFRIPQSAFRNREISLNFHLARRHSIYSNSKYKKHWLNSNQQHKNNRFSTFCIQTNIWLLN